jgi:hypothetical protein
MYNFSIPSALKEWIDNIARAGRTLRYLPPVRLDVSWARRILSSRRATESTAAQPTPGARFPNVQSTPSTRLCWHRRALLHPSGRAKDQRRDARTRRDRCVLFFGSWLRRNWARSGLSSNKSNMSAFHPPRMPKPQRYPSVSSEPGVGLRDFPRSLTVPSSSMWHFASVPCSFPHAYSRPRCRRLSSRRLLLSSQPGEPVWASCPRKQRRHHHQSRHARP